jgi:hypothetical protein
MQKVITKDSSIATDFRWEVYALQQYNEVTDFESDSIVKNVILGINLSDTKIGKGPFSYKLTGGYDILQDDYSASATAGYKKQSLELTASALHGRYSPTFIQDYYYGFSYRWNNNFKDVNYTSLLAEINFKGLKIKLTAVQSIFNNYIYFDTLELPAPSEDNITLTQFILNRNSKIFSVNINNRFGLQFTNTHLVKVPVFQIKHSFYIEKHLFHSALFMQAGFDLSSNSPYYAYAFNPVTGQFHLQTDEKLKFPPVIDLFVNFDIKTFRFFVKLDYANQGIIFQNGYFEAPGYPAQQRGVKLGVDWLLYY